MPAVILTSAKALREERATFAVEIQRQAEVANKENRDFTAEEKSAWIKVNDDYNVVTAKIERMERVESVQRDQADRADASRNIGRDDKNRGGRRKKSDGDETRDAVPTELDRALALQGWLRRSCGKEIRPKHRRAMKKVGLTGRRALSFRMEKDYPALRRNCQRAAWARMASEARSLSSLAQTAGAFTIPEGFMPSLETAMLAFANLRQVADVMRTDSGADIPWPTANDTNNVGALLSENTATATNVDPTFGQVIFHAHKYTSKIILVPVELLEDTAFALAAWLGDRIGERLGRAQASHMTTGTGVGQPMGLITAATLGLTFASPTAIAADELYTLKHSVDPAYRQGASWMMHDQTLLFIKKLKDAQGHYLWQSSLAGGVPDTIDGDPLYINMSMPQIATTNKSLAYGLMSKFKVRDVAEIRLRRLVERYADQDQEGFVAFQRCDSNLLDAGTHPVKYAVHP